MVGVGGLSDSARTGWVATGGGGGSGVQKDSAGVAGCEVGTGDSGGMVGGERWLVAGWELGPVSC